MQDLFSELQAIYERPISKEQVYTPYVGEQKTTFPLRCDGTSTARSPEAGGGAQTALAPGENLAAPLSLRQQVSKAWRYTAPMNRHLRRYAQSAPEPEVIAVFGEAKLVRQMNRRLEIRGGTEAERAQARNWAARFLRSAGGGQWDRAH